LLNVLWSADPFKNKWVILAKAYSTIRDKIGKECAPLDKFLELCCPEIGVVTVSDYLKKLNWTVGSNNKGEFVLTQMQTPDPAKFEAEIRDCYMNEIDVIECCVQRKFFPTLYPLPEAVAANQSHFEGINSMTISHTKEKFLEA
jgi:Mating-type protein MAT alpha 1 HMG-box